MGLDLDVYIADSESEWDPRDRLKRIYRWDRLSFSRENAIFELIGGLMGAPLPPRLKLTVPNDTGLLKTASDCYGTPLRFVLAHEFRKIKARDSEYQKNRAIIAYLRRLAPRTRIILYWS